MNFSRMNHMVARCLTVITLLYALGVSSRLQAEKPIELKVDSKAIDRSTVPTLNSFAPMLKEARKSVVSVHTAEVIRVVRSYANYEEELLRRFFGIPSPRQSPESEEVQEQRIPQGVGSGVIISKDGYILTNNHVVSDRHGGDADEVLVRLTDNRELPAKIVGRDPKTDIALLKVDASNLPNAQIADSDQVEVGDVVFAIGNPLGVGLTVTQGIVSATGRSIGIYGKDGYEDFIQTDASINPGNSGGALVDIEGRVIAINSTILSGTGANIGLGFAIPSHLAVNVARQLSVHGEVRRGYIGFQISELTPDMSEAFGLENVQGVVVDEVTEGLPAHKAGIRRGDVIVKVDNRQMITPNDLRTRVAQHAPGSKIKVSLLRNKKTIDLEVELGDENRDAMMSGGELLEGIEVQPLTSEYRDQLNLREDVRGMVVVAVDPRSLYGNYLSEGMVILEINDQVTPDLSTARKAFRKGVNKMYVYSRGRTGYLAIRLR